MLMAEVLNELEGVEALGMEVSHPPITGCIFPFDRAVIIKEVTDLAAVPVMVESSCAVGHRIDGAFLQGSGTSRKE
jgi:hypothetical protein